MGPLPHLPDVVVTMQSRGAAVIDLQTCSSEGSELGEPNPHLTI